MGMMPMPTAYLDNLIGKTVMSTQFQIQIALMVNKSLNDLVPGYLSSINEESQWGGGFYGYLLKFWLFYGYRLIFFCYG